MARTHTYRVRLDWTGNLGRGTASAISYSRAHTIRAPGKPPIVGSSDPAFRGDSGCWNPEELLLASLSACYQFWYLGLCAEAGVVVVDYEDEPDGTMVEEADGGGQFVAVVLKPRVVVEAGSDLEIAEALHRTAHASASSPVPSISPFRANPPPASLHRARCRNEIMTLDTTAAGGCLTLGRHARARGMDAPGQDCGVDRRRGRLPVTVVLSCRHESGSCHRALS